MLLLSLLLTPFIGVATIAFKKSEQFTDYSGQPIEGFEGTVPTLAQLIELRDFFLEENEK